jgi:hypothetical protein
MGGRNVGCVLTGLEIREGDPVYMAELSKGQVEYEGHSILTPPLLGTYDGYGGITLTESVPCLGREAGEEYDLDDDKRIFVHPDIMEALWDLEMSSGSTFGSYLLAENDTIKTALGESKYFDRAAEKEISDPLIPIALTVNDALIRQTRGTWSRAFSVFSDCFDSEEKMENAQELRTRAHLLKLAEMELRRPLVSFNWAPQEVDSKAKVAVLEKAAQIAQRDLSQDLDAEASDPPVMGT